MPDTFLLDLVSMSLPYTFQRREQWLFGFSTMLALAHLALVSVFVFQRWDTLDFLRLHYTVELGVDWIDLWWHIFLFPGLGLFMLLTNTMLALLLGRRHPTYAVMMGLATALLEIAFAASGVFALLLNV